jgi:hypothetical protein
MHTLYTFTLTLALVFSWGARAEDCVQSKAKLNSLSALTQAFERQNGEAPFPDVLLRFTSATWCHPCQGIKNALIEKKFLEPSSNPSYFTGKIPVILHGVRYWARVEQIEINGKGSDKLRVEPAFNRNVPFFPYTEVFIDGHLVFAGSRDSMGGTVDQPDYDSPVGIKRRLENVILEKWHPDSASGVSANP